MIATIALASVITLTFTQEFEAWPEPAFIEYVRVGLPPFESYDYPGATLLSASLSWDILGEFRLVVNSRVDDEHAPLNLPTYTEDPEVLARFGHPWTPDIWFLPLVENDHSYGDIWIQGGVFTTVYTYEDGIPETGTVPEPSVALMLGLGLVLVSSGRGPRVPQSWTWSARRSLQGSQNLVD
jgi:hypothetical protein